VLNRWLIVAGFAVAQTVFVHKASLAERPPAPPNLSALPLEVGPWKGIEDRTISADLANLKADRALSRTYVSGQGQPLVNLFIAWYQSQANANRQPHSPTVCLPAAGWKPASLERITIPVQDVSITVNRYIVQNGVSRLAVLYWYQTTRRTIASEWGLERYWLLVDAMRDHRTDTALVRVVVPVDQKGDDAAVASASEFVRQIYPQLRQRLM
jgi:EpsI family protein